MANKPDLTKAGGRLKYSVEQITGDSFNKYAKGRASIPQSTLFLWAEEQELTVSQVEKVKKDLPDISIEYIVFGDTSKEPNMNKFKISTAEKDKIIQALEKTLEALEHIRQLQEEKILDLTRKNVQLNKEIDELREKCP
jgi:hypothetical protein